jgi:predicted helicase
MFNSSDSSKTINRLIINSNSMKFSQSSSDISKDCDLCTSANSVRWNTNFSNLTENDDGTYVFELYDYTNMFKNNYIKAIQSENRFIYYIFGQFHDNIYVLGKVITTTEISAEGHSLFNIGNLFNTGYFTKEIYMCRAINSKR